MISLKQHIDGWVGHRDQTDFVEGPQPRLPELPAAPAVVTNENTNGKTMPAEWVEQALQHLATHELEMKKLVVVMTKAARSVNERDERYALQVSDISQRLRSIAHFKDLSRISQMLVNDASSLTACVERIAR